MDGGVALGIAVEKHHLQAQRGQRVGQVDRRRRLADAALLIGHGHHGALNLGHPGVLRHGGHAALTGQEPGDLLGDALRSAFPPADPRTVVAAIQCAVEPCREAQLVLGTPFADGAQFFPVHRASGFPCVRSFLAKCDATGQAGAHRIASNGGGSGSHATSYGTIVIEFDGFCRARRTVENHSGGESTETPSSLFSKALPIQRWSDRAVSIRALNRLDSIVSNSALMSDSRICVAVARSARDSASRLSLGKPWVSESNVTNSALEPSRLCIKFSVGSG